MYRPNPMTIRHRAQVVSLYQPRIRSAGGSAFASSSSRKPKDDGQQQGVHHLDVHSQADEVHAGQHEDGAGHVRQRAQRPPWRPA